MESDRMGQIIKKTIILGVREPQQIDVVLSALKNRYREHNVIRGALFGLSEKKDCLVIAQPEVGGESKGIVLQPYRLGIKVSIECNSMESLYKEVVGLLRQIELPFTLEVL